MLTPEELEQLYASIKNSKALPVWFVQNYKTIQSKNITIEDWNKLFDYLKQVAMDDDALVKIIDILETQSISITTEVIKEISDRIAKDEELEGRLDALATVASTGSYNDLLDKPDIPTAKVLDVKLDDTSVCSGGTANIRTGAGLSSNNGVIKADFKKVSGNPSNLSQAICNSLNVGDIVESGGLTYLVTEKFDNVSLQLAIIYYGNDTQIEVYKYNYNSQSNLWVFNGTYISHTLSTEELRFINEEYVKQLNNFKFNGTYSNISTHFVTVKNTTTDTTVALTSSAENWSYLGGTLYLKPNTQYTIECYASGPSGGNYGLRHSDTAGENVLINEPAGIHLTFYTDMNGEYYLEFYCNYGRTLSGNFTFSNIMLAEGDTPLPFNSYYGKVLHDVDLKPLNTKTQNINANGTKYLNVEEIKNELAPIQIKGNGVSIENDDATEIFTPNANIHIANNGVVEISNDNNANKLKYNMANGDFTIEGSHTLKYNSATGSLTIDGGTVGGGDLYEHRISFIWGNSSISINIITTYSEQVTMSNYKQKLKGNFLYSDNIGWYSSGDGIITIARISIQDIINQYHLNGVSSSTSFTPQLVTDDVQPYV